MEELWKDIEGFEGKYQVSQQGKVLSLNFNNTGKPQILKTKVNKQGYLEVTLNKNDKHYYKLVHRLVFEAFTGMKLGKNDVLINRDGNKQNPGLMNLELITRGQKQEMSYDLGTRYVPKHDFYGEKLTIKEMSRRTGIKRDTIKNRLEKLGWSAVEAAEVPVGIINSKGEKENAKKK